MITLSAVIAYCVANKKALIGGAVVVATILNKLIPEDVGPHWLHEILGRVALFDKEGNLSIVGVEGNKKDEEHV